MFQKYFSLAHGGPKNDRQRRDLSFDRYDREDPCIGMKQIITGFSKWSNRYIAACSGQKNHSYQSKRMTRWLGILNKGNSRKFQIDFSTGHLNEYKRFK